MTSSPFWIKQNDRLPVLERQLLNSDGSAVDLSSSTGVTFRMTRFGETTPKVEAAAIISDPDEGMVQYHWQAGDTDTPGTYESEFEVAFTGFSSLTVPNDGHMPVYVVEELG